MKTRNVAIGIVSLFFPFLASAQAPAEQQEVSTNSLYFSLGRVAFDQEVAAEEGIEDSGTYIRLAWEGQKSTFVYGAGISGFLYSDNTEFSQRVEDQYGREFTKDSEADAFNIFFEGGYSLSLNEVASIDFLGGYEHVFNSSRGISNCSDCRSEDIDITSGLYITPRIRFVTENRLTIFLTYHQYLGGDVEDAFSASIGWAF